MPQVSVLMTARNAEAYIGEALASVTAQNFEDFEIIFVDDCSTDNTVKIVKSINDSRIIIIQQKTHVGRTSALNIGLNIASGDYIAVLDADDLAESSRLLLQMHYLQNHPEIIMIGGGFKCIDIHGRVSDIHHMPTSHADILAKLPISNPIPHSSMTYKRSAALAVGGYPTRIVWAQDFGLIIAMARVGQLANLHECLVTLRLHPHQMTASSEYEHDRLWESYYLLRKARYLPGIPVEAQVEGRRVCAKLAASYDAYLKKRKMFWRRLAFRLYCQITEPSDQYLREAIFNI